MTAPADDRFQRYLAEATAKLDEAAAQLAGGDSEAARVSMKRGIDLVAGARSAATELSDEQDKQMFAVTRAVNILLVSPRHLEPPAPLLTTARELLATVLTPKAPA